MKKTSQFQLATIGFLLFLALVSCKKINESTLVGGDLIPAVDNVTTFEANLAADSTRYFIANDSARLFFNDLAALGHINDPVFGPTTADLYFAMSLPVYNGKPFGSNNTVTVDSVVLSLSYAGAYGDTTAAQSQTVRVFEIAPSARFVGDTAYPFTTGDFAVASELGSRTFNVARLRDTVLVVRKDTLRQANVIRIRLNKQFGERLSRIDSAGYATDSSFRTILKGLAVRSEVSSGNGALSYINLSDQSKTQLTVYYKSTANGVTDTTAVTFTHRVNGQANVIRRQPGGDYAAYAGLGRSPDGKVYLQSTPGSYVRMKIPGLDTLKNKIIHRAELIVHRVPSTLDAVFVPPVRLYLDALSPKGDTAYLFSSDIPISQFGDVDLSGFGGLPLGDNTYRFVITRHVQGIVSGRQRNLPLRLHAPLRADNVAPGLGSLVVPVISAPAYGRVVLGGGGFADPSRRMRLRVIYSNL